MGRNKPRRTITMDEELADYIDHNVDNFSGFINGVLWEVLGEAPLEEPEAETVRVRERVMRMHLQVLEKEIAELERQRDELERILDAAEYDKSVLWRCRLDRIVWGRHAGRPRKEDMTKDKDSDE